MRLADAFVEDLRAVERPSESRLSCHTPALLFRCTHPHVGDCMSVADLDPSAPIDRLVEDFTGPDRPDHETIILSIVLCLLSPGRLYSASDEYLEHLLVLASEQGLVEELQIGLNGAVPEVQFYLSEWVAEGLLMRDRHNGGLRLTSKGLQVALAKIGAERNLAHRDYLNGVIGGVLNECLETVLMESGAGVFRGSPARPALKSLH
jgi:hypothetical protein